MWIDKEGLIRIESMYLGNTTEWLERDYGEDAAATATNPGGSDLAAVRKYLVDKYPMEDERLGAYQEILDDVSSKYGLRLAVRCQGGSLVATFFIGATIDVNGLSEEQEAERITRNLKGLKEVWNRIGDYETELARQ